MSMLNIRPAIEEDCKYFIDIMCPEVKNLPREERLRKCGWWADYEASVFYLNLYRRLNGEVYVAELNGKLVGLIELLPYEDCLLGSRPVINVLWVRKEYRRRGIGRKLVHKAFKWALDKGYKVIDVIPEPEAVGFYEKLEFKIVHHQVKGLKKPKPRSITLKYTLRELDHGPHPKGYLICGVYRPGAFSWHAAWEDEYIPPHKDPIAYEIKINNLKSTIMLDYYHEDKTSILVWCERKIPTDKLAQILAVAEKIALENKIREIFVQTWINYADILKKLNYKILEGKIPWMSKEIE